MNVYIKLNYYFCVYGLRKLNIKLKMFNKLSAIIMKIISTEKTVNLQLMNK